MAGSAPTIQRVIEEQKGQKAAWRDYKAADLGFFFFFSIPAVESEQARLTQRSAKACMTNAAPVVLKWHKADLTERKNK